MLFFLPESQDLVDPGYDFLNDQYSNEDVSRRSDVYVHEILESPPYDGLLVSKSNVSEDLERTIVDKGGIHKHLRVPAACPILGDCGAFQFIDQDIPPYTCTEIYDYYSSLGFDYGVTLDHVIVEFDLDYDSSDALFPRQPSVDMEARFRLSLDNACEMLRLIKERGETFVPIGSAQGWSPQSYHEAVKELVDMGLKYIAIGGVAKASDQVITTVLNEVRATTCQADVGLHVLGVARLSLLRNFTDSNVISCDSASPLMQAFKSNASNYVLPENRSYACVRIPPTGVGTSLAPSPKINKILAPLKHDVVQARSAYKREPENREFSTKLETAQIALDNKLETLAALEKQALDSLRSYANRSLPIASTIRSITCQGNH